MIQARFVANASALAGLLLLLFAPIVTRAEQPKTAAQLDWVPAANLTPEERAKLPWYCSGEYQQPPPATGIAPGYVRATADKGNYIAGKDTELTGHVHMAQQYRSIDSPHVKLDATRQIANVDGPLVIRDKGLTLTGSHAVSNLEDNTGIVDNATFLLVAPKLRGHARQVRRLKSTDMIITDGVLTRCEPGSDVWAIHGKRIRLEPSTGFGTARNVTIDIKNVPLVYLPYIRFPIDNKRHSGFLMPSLGYDHVGGTDIALPYYFNLAPEYDFTYEPRSLWKRGIIHTMQFRFLAGASTNEINAAYIAKDGVYDDRKLVDSTTGNVNTTAANAPPWIKKDRWLLNIRHTGDWSSHWTSSIDYSAVSDVDYLHDIGGNVGSSTVDQFVNSVDQNLTSARSAALTRLGQISYQSDAWNSTLKVEGFQNLSQIAPPQYRLLPQLNTQYGGQLGPVTTSLQVQYSNFDKNTTGVTGPLAILGQREVVDAGLSIRGSKPWGYIEPEVDVVQRSYQLRNVPASYPTQPHVTTPRMSIDAGLYFDRFFQFRHHSLRQTLEPRVFYLYTGYDNQDDLPRFDVSPSTPSFEQIFRNNRYAGWDRIGDARQVSVGLTSRFLDRDTGSQYLETSLGQIYYLEDRKVIYRPSPVDDPTAPRSPLFWEAQFTLGGFDVTGSYEWEPSANRTNRAHLSLQYISGDRKIFNLSYIYTSPQVQPVGEYRTTKQSDVSFVWPVSGRWSAIARWNFAWDLNQTIESIVGVEYNDCCWESRLVVRQFLNQPRTITVLENDPTSSTGYKAVTNTFVPHDTGIFFEFQLKGLATLGRRLDNLLESAIPGYRAREEEIGN